MRASLAAACAAILLLGSAASADPWKEKSEKYRWYIYDDSYRGEFVRERSAYKEEFRYDGCKIERKWERNGAYKEEAKCERRRR